MYTYIHICTKRIGQSIDGNTVEQPRNDDVNERT